MNDLGRWVMAARVKKGMTRSALAKAAGVGEYTLQRLEEGIGAPTVETLTAVLRALGAPEPTRSVLLSVEPKVRRRLQVAAEIAREGRDK